MVLSQSGRRAKSNRKLTQSRLVERFDSDQVFPRPHFSTCRLPSTYLVHVRNLRAPPPDRARAASKLSPAGPRRRCTGASSPRFRTRLSAAHTRKPRLVPRCGPPSLQAPAKADVRLFHMVTHNLSIRSVIQMSRGRRRDVENSMFPVNVPG